MKETVFVDTNILLYRNDPSDLLKNDSARKLIENHFLSGTLTVSTQVINEFVINSIHKFKQPLKYILKEIEFYKTAKIIPVETRTIDLALKIFAKHKFSYWDSLIIAAAIEGGCKTVYTEDLTHGQTVAGVKIINPFLSAN